jgi:neutral trehalase
LIVHDRLDLVIGHILEHLQEIERFGRVLNYNVVRQQRSQPPLLSDTVRRYHTAHPDLDLLWRAYPLLKREYQQYWLAPHHLTPTGLSTFRDPAAATSRAPTTNPGSTTRPSGAQTCAIALR